MLELLPEDILIIILKKLDFKSQAYLYEALECVKGIFIGYKVVKECNLSLSSLATVKTLETPFFKIIAPNLLKLDLSAVNDISKTSLMPVMAKLKHLSTLDVSYTKINLKDFIEIYKLRPTLKNITIQFNFGPKYLTIVPMDIILECQNIFKSFDCIHFFGTYYNLMVSNIVLFMLQLSNLKILQFTLSDKSLVNKYRNNYLGKYHLRCKCFYISYPFQVHFSISTKSFPFNVVENNSYEYLVVHSDLKNWDAYGSPLFNNFFKEKFDTNLNNSLSSWGEICNTNGNGCIMLWMKNSETFDEVFFNSLYKKMRQFLVCFTLDSWPLNAISKYDKFCITPREKESCNIHSSVEFGFKRKRIVTQNLVLDYDEEFREKEEVELNFMFSLYTLRTAITLNSNCEYLKRLTYLNFIGTEKYSATFFNILFRSCVKLVTLNVSMDNLRATDVARSAPLSQTIKNLRVVAKMIDFNSVLTSLSQCPTIENIHIVEMSSATPSTLFDPTTLIQRCSNLYCAHIYDCGISASKQTQQMKIIENAKSKFHKPHLSFKVLKSSINWYQESMPYVDVFRLSQIKIIKLF